MRTRTLIRMVLLPLQDNLYHELATDSLVNFETVKYFASEAREVTARSIEPKTTLHSPTQPHTTPHNPTPPCS